MGGALEQTRPPANTIARIVRQDDQQRCSKSKGCPGRVASSKGVDSIRQPSIGTKRVC